MAAENKRRRTVEDTEQSELTAANSLMTFDELSNTNSVVSESASCGSSPATNEPVCVVCGRHNAGLHYSVFACRGCKVFFRRTVEKNIVYTCRESKNCLIDKFSRKNCQFCRFQQCLNSGMSIEAVHDDQNHSPDGMPRKKMRLDGEPSAGCSSFMENLKPECVLSDEEQALIDQVVAAKPDIVPQLELQDVYPDYRPDMEIDQTAVVHCSYVELSDIIEWSGKVPGFCDLSASDRVALLKSSFPELLMLRAAYRSLDCGDGLKLCSSFTLSVEHYLQVGYGQDLMNSFIDFMSSLRTIGIDLTEFCILNAVLVTYPDATGLVDRTSVIQLQSRLLGCLQKYSTSKYPATPTRYAKLLLRLPALRSLAALGAERFLNLSLDANVKINPLVLEMFS